MKKKIKGILLEVITIMAVYLIFCSVGIIDLPEWDKSWIIPQICMFIVGMTWMCLMGKANGWFCEDEEHGEKRNRRKSSENH